jgi:hypothetical protein
MEAPALLAEAFVDGVLIVGLARRVRPRRAPHWVVGVVRRTWLPVVVVAVIFALVGSLLQQVQPGARTLAEALHQAQHR